jgi:serine/threonine protein kinase
MQLLSPRKKSSDLVHH